MSCGTLDQAQYTACELETGLACERDIGWRIQGAVVDVDPEAAEECLEGLASAGCTAVQSALASDEFEVFDMTSGCETNELLRPRARIGQPCGAFSDCVEGFCPYAEKHCHRCLPFVSLGQPCAAGSAQCDPAHQYCGAGGDGLRCRMLKKPGEPCSHWSECEDHVCRPGGAGTVCGSLAVGDPCTRADACGPSNFCRRTSHGGVCAPRAKTGDPCSPRKPDDGCAEGEARCVDGRCLVHPYILGFGQPCDELEDCHDGLYCKRPLDHPGSGTCATQGTEGEPCELINFGSCQPGLGCIAGHCRKLGSQGEPCFGPFLCRSYLSCLPDSAAVGFSQAHCVPRRAAGAPCGPSVACLAGWCDTRDGGSTCAALLAGGEPCWNEDQCLSGQCDGLPDGGGACRGTCFP